MFSRKQYKYAFDVSPSASSMQVDDSIVYTHGGASNASETETHYMWISFGCRCQTLGITMWKQFHGIFTFPRSFCLSIRFPCTNSIARLNATYKWHFGRKVSQNIIMHRHFTDTNRWLTHLRANENWHHTKYCVRNVKVCEPFRIDFRGFSFLFLVECAHVNMHGTRQQTYDTGNVVHRHSKSTFQFFRMQTKFHE